MGFGRYGRAMPILRNPLGTAIANYPVVIIGGCACGLVAA